MKEKKKDLYPKISFRISESNKLRLKARTLELNTTISGFIKACMECGINEKDCLALVKYIKTKRQNGCQK